MSKKILGISLICGSAIASLFGGYKAYALYKSNAEDMETHISAPLKTIYFTNNYSWSSIKAYYWGGTNAPSWPGVDMTFAYKNGMNQDVYRVTFVNDNTSIIFNNNSGSQTVDIDISSKSSGTGYYISGQFGDKYTVGEWHI